MLPLLPTTNISGTHAAIRQMSAVYTHRHSTKVSGIHTAIQQMPAAHAPLFDNVSGIHRYSTKFSGIHTAIPQMSAVYTPPFDQSQRQSKLLYSASRASSRNPASSSRVKPRLPGSRSVRADMAAVVSTLWPPRVLAIGVDPPPRPIVLRVDHCRLFLETF